MSSEIERRAVELAWRQWTALGVSGVAPVPAHAVDVEALMAFTPFVAAADPRLGDEARDWCARVGPHFVSRSRLRQIARLMPDRDGTEEALLKAMLREPTRPGARRALSGKSRKPRLAEPPLIQLRSRHVFGIGARADVITTLVLGTRGEPLRISSLELVGYTKPAIAAVLDDLASAGVLTKLARGHVSYFVVDKLEPLRALLAPVPPRPPNWVSRLTLIATTLTTWRRFGSRSTYAIELAKALDRANTRALPSGVAEQPPIVGRPRALLVDVDRWAASLLDA